LDAQPSFISAEASTQLKNAESPIVAEEIKINQKLIIKKESNIHVSDKFMDDFISDDEFTQENEEQKLIIKEKSNIQFMDDFISDDELESVPPSVRTYSLSNEEEKFSSTDNIPVVENDKELPEDSSYIASYIKRLSQSKQIEKEKSPPTDNIPVVENDKELPEDSSYITSYIKHIEQLSQSKEIGK
jgi:hypothetical protein